MVAKRFICHASQMHRQRYYISEGCFPQRALVGVTSSQKSLKGHTDITDIHGNSTKT